MAGQNKNTELAKVEEAPTKRPLMPIIVDHQEMLADFLPDHIDHDKFFLVANGVLRGSKYLRDCLSQKKGVEGFLKSLKQAAMDGLIPDGTREAAIVPYKGVPTYVRMYGGMLKMMRQSGVVTDINTGLVCENDEFDFVRGTKNFVHHKAAFKNRGDKIAAWCVIRTKDGGEYFDIMGADEIMQIKSAVKAQNGPWGNKAHEGQMWRKTVLRRTAGLAPISTDMHNAFAREDAENYDFDHLQKPSPAARLEANMAASNRGQVIGLDPTDPNQTAEDATYSEEEEPQGETSPEDPKWKLTENPDDMTGEKWEKYTDKLLKDLEKRGISGKAFDALYKPELDHMARLSSADFDRMLDAMQARDQADGDKKET